MSAAKKIVLGQFYTKEALWLKPQVLEFIKSSNCKTAYDPFAGEGHLLFVAKNLGFEKLVGLDIDSHLGWHENDSLIKIPTLSTDTMIITNPPYLSNYSASRKGIISEVKKYYDSSPYDDLYLIALEKMLDAHKFIVAIIPETFINSNFKLKNYLSSITILEESPFDDTDVPVIVACFDGIDKPLSKVDVYKNDVYINNLQKLEEMRLKPTGNVKMKFNDLSGWLAVRCVDTTNPKEKIRFDFKCNIDYDWNTGIKHSSRLLTIINLNIKEELKHPLINECNLILAELRHDSGDVILSPFKGNGKDGKRRRRLDFKTCRAIIEEAYSKLIH